MLKLLREDKLLKLSGRADNWQFLTFSVVSDDKFPKLVGKVDVGFEEMSSDVRVERVPKFYASFVILFYCAYIFLMFFNLQKL